ncbi:MAG TPA: hypothetical protein VGA61_17805 [Anaerolineae bacterium]
MTHSSEKERRLNRRAFLRLLGGSGAALLLTACRRALPDLPAATSPAATTPGALAALPAASPAAAASAGSRLALPLVSRSGVPATATPTPTASPAPTATATATPTQAAALPAETATKRPRPTPLPTATPFPPGPPTKLGIFIGRNDPRIRDMLGTGNVAVVKTLEYDPSFAVELKQRAPHALLIGRLRLPDGNLSSMTDPEAAAEAFVDQLLPIATEPRRLAAFDAWESLNEPVANDAEEMKRLARYEARRTRLLAQAGVRSVIGNFATGHPPLELWPYFRPALEAALETKGYLGLHEYSAPTMQFGTPQALLHWGNDPGQDGWLTLRYRKVYRSYLEPNNLALPLIMTECGIDGMVGSRPGPQGQGWQDFAEYWWKELGMGPNAAGNYMQQLAWYDAQLQQDAYVRGAAIFAAAPPQGWESYEILGDVEPLLRQYINVHPAT